MEELLAVCPEQGLHLTWYSNQCQIRPLGAEQDGATAVLLPKSVFRALLARVAVLCNEHSPGSVSPYGGEGELSVGASPPTVFRVTFANTPGEQWLEMKPSGG
jgi:hypothetical protein